MASIPVSDPFGVTDDPHMPFLAHALDPLEAQRQLTHGLGCTERHENVALHAIRVVRHKPGRRCLIEYDLKLERSHTSAETLTVIGKARARGLDRANYALLVALWNTGFAADSTDEISVPEPLGVIAPFQMWLQRKVPGVTATRLLPKMGGVDLARRIAEAAHKLHQSGIPPRRCHTLADELRILHERLTLVAELWPAWTQRLQRLLRACDRCGADIPASKRQSIHRDFYPDQLIVDGTRSYLLDLDLYCAGDPGLDIGNCIGHLTEQALRTLGDVNALVDREAVLEERFVELAGERTRSSIQAYTTLTLVRHIFLSTQFPDRRAFTEPLLELCEQRLCRYW